jgi:hypothetical protein
MMCPFALTLGEPAPRPPPLSSSFRFTHLALINAVMHVIGAEEQLVALRAHWTNWR